jgi:GNAT superfamily N-acetyltransferase
MEGGPPETEADWRRVADTLRQLHRFTRGWPQRPGWRSSTDLARRDGTKIDLGAVPPEGVARCRAAWARLIGRQTCVVHGDPTSSCTLVVIPNLTRSGQPYGLIENVVTHSTYRGRGFGKHILQEGRSAWKADCYKVTGSKSP